uniref:ATP synthase F0 subunit 8 n=1 Tax=Chelonus formosanus TaxID=2739011 RepID=A0A8K1PTM4_9HYME|nr:ATP synthase F0 subunit 8 [Chelonus formosanus]UBR43341.1 ATP synthase F0 subunit 8 [Chelonus formosanus]UDP58210.1 ATP synthase F0 subunit 8 [Chelonus formosanus]UHY94330.1 ATP synthase F0 subunit 8 [Chelonus formosanus]UJM44025.1 ATP synthase F0 subunit 8 [Chelonus formosanus]
MPQMSPMNWLFLFLFNLTNYMFFLLFIYYMIYYKLNNLLFDDNNLMYNNKFTFNLNW